MRHPGDITACTKHVLDEIEKELIKGRVIDGESA